MAPPKSPETLRRLAEFRLWVLPRSHTHLPLVFYPLELMHGDLHYLVHLLRGAGCSDILVRRVQLFHALVRGCRLCSRHLSRHPDLDLYLHADEIPSYWTHFALLSPGIAKRTCTCPQEEHCRFSWYFRAPTHSGHLTNPLVCRAPGLPADFYPAKDWDPLPDQRLDATLGRALR